MTACFVSAKAVQQAAIDARQQVLKIASQALDVDAERLILNNRRIYVKDDPEKGMPLAAAIRLSLLKGTPILGLGAAHLMHEGEVWANWGSGQYQGQQTGAYTFGTTVAEVEVDSETGQVTVLNIVQANDCGFAINPMAVEGQWEGATVQAVGLALYEKHEWDEKGRLLTSTFLDYKMPSAMDAPKITPIIIESIDPNGPYGAKEAGIVGTLSTSGAIANAIYDAIGVRIKELPITPETILKAVVAKIGNKA